MVFSDLFFLFVFIPVFAILYVLAGWIEKKFPDKMIGKDNCLKNIVLVIFSLLFYAWGEPVYVFLLLFCVLINYLMGLWINVADRNKKIVLGVGIALNVGIILIFKYAGFIARSLSMAGLEVKDPNILLPIGISFFVFQSMSYLIDVYRGTSPVQRNFWNLLLYISMFPQLIAGPIVRYGTIANEIKERHVDARDLSEGIFRFLIGLAKKVILANQLGEVVTMFLQQGFDNLTVLGAWVGLIAFTLQLYFDFSGYSDMAIGIGRCLGFHFCENFEHPYCSRSITEFWRRWHISLGTWFRDYVYIPLGGNRRHQLINILIVWFLTGMWHGASWNFIMWGVYFGIIVLVEKYTVLKIIDKVPSALMRMYTLAIVIIGMGFFYFEDSSKMCGFFATAFGLSGAPFTDFVSHNILFEKFWLFVAAIVLCMPVRKLIDVKAQHLLSARGNTYVALLLTTRVVVSTAILFICVALLVGATNNAFLYTRF